MSNTFEENGIALLARVDDIDFNIGVPTTTNLFTIPTGFQCVVSHVVFKPAAAGFTTLAANTQVDLGKVGATDDWKDGYDPSGMTDGDACEVISPDSPCGIYDAAEIFALTNNDTSAAGSLVDVLVYGTLMVA